jgi:2-dehydro-3-deoxygluconokinase
MKQRIITLGEVMLRLQPPNFARLEQANSLDIVFGGGEANVAIGLAHLGFEAAHVTAFPDNAIGKRAVKYLREHLLDTQHVKLEGSRMGIYFVENGAAMRASQVVYDRYGSAFSEVTADTFDWKTILKDATWFHWAGITPALSQGAADACLEAVKTAKEMGITVSADIFYRSNLWKYGKTPQEILPELASYTDIVIANEQNIDSIFGIQNTGFVDAAEKLMNRYGTIKQVIDTHRISVSASRNILSASLFDGQNLFKTAEIDIDPIIDRIGGGDAFIAGLIYGLNAFNSTQDSLDFALAATALKHTIEGDANVLSVEEITSVMKGDMSGRLRR